MGTIITDIILVIAIMFIIGMNLGRVIEHSKHWKLLRRGQIVLENDELTKVKLDQLQANDKFGLFIASLFLGGWVVMMLVFSGIEYTKDYVIDSYRKDEIVEQVKYRYQTINNEKVIIDSTFQYVRRK